MEQLFFSIILIPLISSAFVALFTRRRKNIAAFITLAVCLFNIIMTAYLFKTDMVFSRAWVGFGIDMAFRSYHFSAFILAAIALFTLLITIYCIPFLKMKEFSEKFYALTLLSLGMANGAVLADNLILLLFFWESLLITLFGMIIIGSKNAFKTAAKALIIVGASDICIIAGIALIYSISGTFTISKLHIGLNGMGSLAFLLMMTGAIAKAGSMPFHSWIPDASQDAPLPFMALIPAAIEKLLGIYLLVRISLNIFQISAGSWASYTLMIIGCVTIIAAVGMALIQKDYKKLLSYHAISQVGYMILGIGTLLPAGIVGGLFHMINHALYKSGLFLTGGSIEKQAGTTDLERLGGLAKIMPITFICFLITAASISGVPPFNGFFSKELVYEAALKRGAIFYAGAIIGSFLTAISFLKLGHAAYAGRSKINNIKEAPFMMLLPMIIIASLCIMFGIWNFIPIGKLIQPILGSHLEGHDFSVFHVDPFLLTMTIVVLIAALINHLFGYKKYGSGLKAADHIHYAPVLVSVYDKAEKGRLDPYNVCFNIMQKFSVIMDNCDKYVNWIYSKFIPNLINNAGTLLQEMHNGSYRIYIVWSIAAGVIVILFLLNSR